MRLDTPPSSIHGDDEIMNDGDLEDEEEELEYVGDLDEVLEGEEPDDSDISESGEDIKDDALLVFSRHTGSVFCGSIHPTRKLAVTGGEDDKAYVWNVETANVVLECSEHEDSVIFAEFSSDGMFLATADMGGSIRVAKCPSDDDDDWTCVWDYQAGDISWGKWHHSARVLFCATVAGDIYMWKMPSGDTKVLQGHGQKTECGVLLSDGRRLAVGYEDGAIKIWDLKSSTVLFNISQDLGHAGNVTSIDTFHDNNIIATGSVDGKVLLTKSLTGKNVGILDVGSEIEAISFCKDPTLGLIAIGTIDGSLSIWDVGRQTVRHKCSDKTDENASGISSLIWIKNHVAAACLDGSLKIYDSKSGSLVKTFTGHRADILDMFYSTALNILLTTSDDGTSRIYNFDLTANEM